MKEEKNRNTHHPCVVLIHCASRTRTRHACARPASHIPAPPGALTLFTWFHGMQLHVSSRLFHTHDVLVVATVIIIYDHLERVWRWSGDDPECRKRAIEASRNASNSAKKHGKTAVVSCLMQLMQRKDRNNHPESHTDGCIKLPI